MSEFIAVVVSDGDNPEALMLGKRSSGGRLPEANELRVVVDGTVYRLMEDARG